MADYFSVLLVSLVSSGLFLYYHVKKLDPTPIVWLAWIVFICSLIIQLGFTRAVTPLFEG